MDNRDGRPDAARRSSGAEAVHTVLRVNAVHFPVHTLGPGRRLLVWTQGCTLACPGCMSRHTWDPHGGTAYTVDELLERWDAALRAGADGLTVSGGEPLDQPGPLAALLAGAAARARRAAADQDNRADLLLYTGYDVSDVTAQPARAAAARHADALITGRFQVAEPTPLVWRGSANQRLVPVTGLGRSRYAAHRDRPATGPRLETVQEERGDVRLHGVPLRGELAAVERSLRRVGVRLDGASWRSGAPVHRER